MEASAYNHFASSAVCRQRVHVCRGQKTQLCELIFSPAAAKADDLTIAKLLMVRAEQCEQNLVHGWHSLMWELTCAKLSSLLI
jgi:hypothetical protein